jgi:hypothetical protein
VAVDVTEHQRVVAGKLQRQCAALTLPRAQDGNSARIEVDNARLVCSLM